MAGLTTEDRNPLSQGLQAVPAEVALSRMLDAQQGALAAIRPAVPVLARAAEIAAKTLRSGHRLGYAGAGSSGLMALSDRLELAGTFGIAPERTPMLFAGGTAALSHMIGGVEDDLALAGRDLAASGLGAGDAIICLSASGRTPYTVEVARQAKARGVTVIAFANVAGSPLLAAADVAILIETGAEIVAGSTRLGAATAQKVALNMLSVQLGIGLGHVHEGYMVNVVADNAKLVDRAARIVAAVSGAGSQEARAALGQTAGAVKPAILIAAGAAPARAAELLDRHGGHLGPALREIGR